MPERDNDADVIRHVQTSPRDLTIEAMWTQGCKVVSDEAVEGEEDGHGEAEKRDHLVWGQAILPDEFDGGVGKDPEGEAGEREPNRAEV